MIKYIQSQNPPDLGALLKKIVPRNSASCYMLYGSAFPYSNVEVTSEGEVLPWVARWWISSGKVTHVQQLPLQKLVDEGSFPNGLHPTSIGRNLPILLSINPMGLPMVRPRDAKDLLSIRTQRSLQREQITIAHILPWGCPE